MHHVYTPRDYMVREYKQRDIIISDFYYMIKQISSTKSLGTRKTSINKILT